MKLTKSNIEQVVNRYADDKFKELMEKADNAMLLAGSALYDAIFGSGIEKIKAIPQGWFSERDSFIFYVDGSKFRIENYRVKMNTTKRVPMDGYVRSLPEKADAETVKAAIKNYDDKCGEREALGDKKTEFRRDMIRFACQFTTVEKLTKHYEELANYFFGYEKTANLPTITHEQIREKYSEII